jgi:alkylated DNA repair dioxygenase AlkB
MPDQFDRTAPQTDLFAAAGHLPAPLPAGFAHRPELISPAEEAVLAEHCAALPFAPFEFQGHLAKRQVVSFGWRYDYAGRTLRESAAMPDFLRELRDRAAEFAGIAADRLQQILINLYEPGAGIGWHRDKAMFEDVIAVSLLGSCRLRLRRKRDDGTWERAAVSIEPRSVYLLRGPVRRAWEHSIPEVERRRLSITFRTLRGG